MEQPCNNLPGHSDCAKATFKTHMGKPCGCPGNGLCVSRRKENPEANVGRARIFLDDLAVALRYMGHSKHEKHKVRLALTQAA
jgi:hypothetical protein